MQLKVIVGSLFVLLLVSVVISALVSATRPLTELNICKCLTHSYMQVLNQLPKLEAIEQNRDSEKEKDSSNGR